METERITLSRREQERAVVLTRIAAGAWTVAEAAQVLDLSPRQVQRLLRAYEARGPAALVQGHRGGALGVVPGAGGRPRLLAVAVAGEPDGGAAACPLRRPPQHP